MLDDFYCNSDHAYYIDDEDMTPEIIQEILDVLKDNNDLKLKHYNYYLDDDTKAQYFSLEWD